MALSFLSPSATASSWCPPSSTSTGCYDLNSRVCHSPILDASVAALLGRVWTTQRTRVEKKRLSADWGLRLQLDQTDQDERSDLW